MKINDITILKSVEPIIVLDKPNPKTLEHLVKLINNETFSIYIDTLRTQNNLPKEGINIKELTGKNFSELPPINNSLSKLSFEYIAHELSTKMGISDDFNLNMLLLLFFNAFIDIDYFEGFITSPIEFVIGRKNIAVSTYDYAHEVGAIIIPYNVSQNTLVKWIEENWKSIQEQMNKNITFNPYLLRLHKNTEIASEIVSLKDKEHKTFKEISDILTNKYPDNEYAPDGEWVKKVYYDYKELWNKPSAPSTEKK